jgi:hypothetical protein
MPNVGESRLFLHTRKALLAEHDVEDKLELVVPDT